MIEVADSGPGIALGDQAAIFIRVSTYFLIIAGQQDAWHRVRPGGRAPRG